MKKIHVLTSIELFTFLSLCLCYLSPFDGLKRPLINIISNWTQKLKYDYCHKSNTKFYILQYKIFHHNKNNLI